MGAEHPQPVLRFASLGSGSRGNGLLVETATTRVLIDCGFSLAQTRSRLARLGRRPADLDAIVVTHEHGDHCSGVAALAGAAGIPVWMTPGTSTALQWQASLEVRALGFDGSSSVGDLLLLPFAVPHDAREPAQLVLEHAGRRLGVLTDAGSVTPHMVEHLSGCDALVLECNHDRDLLRTGADPYPLKRRIASDWGHLSNDQAAEVLRRVDRGRLRHVAAAHLSERNNRPGLALAALAAVLDGSPTRLCAFDQRAGGGWLEVP